MFPAIVEDRQRGVQICRDVHDALKGGRTCVVLTRRTDHIDAGLAELGEHALMLRGRLGAKARRAVADALAARDPDVGFVLAATGSHLGEGFNWPELSTLFLAFPLAFKGRVQDVGRRLRTHAGKLHAELHDYVDSRIHVLDRKHTKRRSVYTSLGFDLTTSRRTRRTAPTSGSATTAH